jgi:hypothetical protein
MVPSLNVIKNNYCVKASNHGKSSNDTYLWGMWGKNSVRKQQLYTARYPENTRSSQQTFSRLIKNICEVGSRAISPDKRNRRKTQTNLLKLLFYVQFQIILILALDKLEVILEFLKQMYTAFLNIAYGVSLHQELHGNDFQNRVQLCQ